MSITTTDAQETVTSYKTLSVDGLPDGTAVSAMVRDGYYVLICNSPTASSALTLPQELAPSLMELLTALTAPA